MWALGKLFIQNMEKITMTDLRLDEQTAGALACTGLKMKPIGVSRAYKVPVSFSIGEDEFQAGDYIVLSPAGDATGKSRKFVESNFCPVAKRTGKVTS